MALPVFCEDTMLNQRLTSIPKSFPKVPADKRDAICTRNQEIANIRRRFVLGQGYYPCIPVIDPANADGERHFIIRWISIHAKREILNALEFLDEASNPRRLLRGQAFD